MHSMSIYEHIYYHTSGTPSGARPRRTSWTSGCSTTTPQSRPRPRARPGSTPRPPAASATTTTGSSSSSLRPSESSSRRRAAPSREPSRSAFGQRLRAFGGGARARENRATRGRWGLFFLPSARDDGCSSREPQPRGPAVVSRAVWVSGGSLALASSRGGGRRDGRLPLGATKRVAVGSARDDHETRRRVVGWPSFLPTPPPRTRSPR